VTLDRRTLLAAALAAPLAAGAARADVWEDLNKRGLLTDPAGLGRYGEDNLRLLATRARVDIVFMGDSITEGWKSKRPGFFTPGRVGRGISGQTTPQMLLRFMADVVALKPRAVHIMAGTNDIAGNTGPMTPQMTEDNFRAMSAIARQNCIKVLLASIPPAASFPWRPAVETRRAWLAPEAAVQLVYAATEAPMMQWFVNDTCRREDARIPIGYPLPGNHLALVDEDGRATPPGEVGELIVGGQYVSLGSWVEGRLADKSVETDATHGERIFRTGDLARQRPDGLLERVGRKDRQVKIRGFRVDLDGVTYVSPSGKSLLRLIHREGAHLVAGSCMARGIVEEIES